MTWPCVTSACRWAHWHWRGSARSSAASCISLRSGTDLPGGLTDEEASSEDRRPRVPVRRGGLRRLLPGDQVRSVGITCALCHSTVDDAFAPGIGHRLDGWPNRDLNVGQIITLAPNLKPLTDRLGISEEDLKKALLAWGPGKYDAELVHDGKAFRPDGKTAATLLPA